MCSSFVASPKTKLRQAVILNIPLDSSVVPDAKAFLTNLSHLPIEVQIDLLRDATSQITEAVERAIA